MAGNGLEKLDAEGGAYPDHNLTGIVAAVAGPMVR